MRRRSGISSTRTPSSRSWATAARSPRGRSGTPTAASSSSATCPATCAAAGTSQTGFTEVANPSNKGNGMTFDLEGRLVVCEHVTSSLVRMDPDGSGSGREVLASHYDGKELNSPNDVVVKSDGAIYFTDPTYGRMPGFGLEREQDLDFQGVYRIAPGGGDRSSRRRLRPAQRAVLLGRRVAALHQRHRPRPHPRLRRRGRRLARERARLRRGHRHGRASRSATSSTA